MKPKVLLALLIVAAVVMSPIAWQYRPLPEAAGLKVTAAATDVQLMIGRDRVSDSDVPPYRVAVKPGQDVIIMSDIDPHDLYITSDESPAVVVHQGGRADNPRPSFEVPASGVGQVYLGYFGAVWTLAIHPDFVEVTSPRAEALQWGDTGAAVHRLVQGLQQNLAITLPDIESAIANFEAQSGQPLRLRVIPPHQMMTMDLSFGRINVDVDRSGAVTRIWQG